MDALSDGVALLRPLGGDITIRSDEMLLPRDLARILYRHASIEDAAEAIVRYILALKALGGTSSRDALRTIRKATVQTKRVQ